MNSPETQKTIQKNVVIAACFGTFLEWYDFLTFASLAIYFSVLFFPSGDPVAASATRWPACGTRPDC